MRIVGLYLLLLVAGLLCALLSVFALPAHGAVRSGESPPECAHWRVFNNGGAGPLVRWLVCGTGSNGESPARDDTNWQTIIIDGDSFTSTDGCGLVSWANPCVLLWPGSPQGFKAGS
jgi:hypothetical protein